MAQVYVGQVLWLDRAVESAFLSLSSDAFRSDFEVADELWVDTIVLSTRGLGCSEAMRTHRNLGKGAFVSHVFVHPILLSEFPQLIDHVLLLHSKLLSHESHLDLNG